MQRETRILAIYGGLGAAFVGAYWAYLYYQDPENAPNVTDLFETVKSWFTRSYDVASSAALDTIGKASYMDKATALLAKLEGFSAKAYNDVGKLAIGYGHDIRPNDPYNKDSIISNDEARQLLSQDLLFFDSCITNSVSVPLSDNQRAALLSFVYNIGCDAFKSSTIRARINSGDFDGAAQEFSRWIYSTDPHTGAKIVNATLRDQRRPAEEELFVA